MAIAVSVDVVDRLGDAVPVRVANGIRLRVQVDDAVPVLLAVLMPDRVPEHVRVLEGPWDNDTDRDTVSVPHRDALQLWVGVSVLLSESVAVLRAVLVVVALPLAVGPPDAEADTEDVSDGDKAVLALQVKVGLRLSVLEGDGIAVPEHVRVHVGVQVAGAVAELENDGESGESERE